MSMEIRFWGVRGSIATPGEETIEVGGNTSCVELRCGSTTLICDAGTGLRPLGDKMLRAGEREATILFSHLHWDHIQGLPFFVPAWIPHTRLRLLGGAHEGLPIREALEAQMRPPHFPVRLSEMRAQIEIQEIAPGSPVRVGEATIECARLNHPGGVYAYRVEHGGRAVVYATDTEHYALPDPRLIALAKDADVLIYDAMYTEDEYMGRSGPSKVGWGHSTWEAGVAVAEAAGVDRLVLFHHDPQRCDEGVRRIESLAAAARPGTVAAREGDTLTLPARPSEGRDREDGESGRPRPSERPRRAA